MVHCNYFIRYQKGAIKSPRGASNRRFIVTNQELEEVYKHPTTTVPIAGKARGLSYQGSYDAAKRGEIKTLRFGHLLKVPTKWLREQLEGGA